MTEPYRWPPAGPWQPTPPPGPRPGQATAAAVLGFVQAGVHLLVVLVVLLAAAGDGVTSSDVGLGVLATLAGCSLAALLLLGGVFLLRGAGCTLLLVTSCVEAGLLGLLALVALVGAVGGDPVSASDDAAGLLVVLLALAGPVVRLALLARPPLRAWVAAVRHQRAVLPPPVWFPDLGHWVPGRPAAPLTGAVLGTVLPVAGLAVVTTVVLATAGAGDSIAHPYDTGSTATGDVADPPEPGDPDFSPRFDGLAQDCRDGDMYACDDLYAGTPVGDAYETYGSTCGGRLYDETYGGCVSTFGPTD